MRAPPDKSCSSLPATQTCRINHPQFKKGCGCVKYKNLELGAQARLLLDRSSRVFKLGYAWRTTTERIFSQAKELGIERPRLRNLNSIRNHNTLIYIVINVNAPKRAPVCLLACLPACLSACLPVCLLACLRATHRQARCAQAGVKLNNAKLQACNLSEPRE